LNIDELVKTHRQHFSIIPVKMGIQDSRLRGSEDLGVSLRNHQSSIVNHHLLPFSTGFHL
jgi:hypothetical protein